MREGLANFSGETSGLLVLGCLKTQAEKVMQRKPIDYQPFQSAADILSLSKHWPVSCDYEPRYPSSSSFMTSLRDVTRQ